MSKDIADLLAKGFNNPVQLPLRGTGEVHCKTHRGVSGCL